MKGSLLNRELSWLSFNERVLQESINKSNPLVERLRFLGIYSNNMDEFYRVRVANIHRFSHLKDFKFDDFKGSPKELLKKIQDIVDSQRRLFDLSYQRIIQQMESHEIFHLDEKKISDELLEPLKKYFNESLKQDIVPIIINKKYNFPRLLDKEIYLAIKIVNYSQKIQYALIQIPSNHNRFFTVQIEKSHFVILIDDIIRKFLTQIFGIFEIKEISAHTFKFTRNADLHLDDDISISMYEKMKKSIGQRKKGEPVRFIYDIDIPEDLLSFLKRSLDISEEDHLLPGGKYHNFKDLMSFPDFENEKFIFEKKKPNNHPKLPAEKSILNYISRKDLLLHYPYQKFDHLVDFLREAAIDPTVKEIKINIYRLAKKSQVVNALINAVRNGKKVIVIVELQARFDEENNMNWASLLRDQGAKIIYGVPGLKVHSKLIQITRTIDKKEQLIVHIGTGNFHSQTAKTYTDLSLFTANKAITGEVKKVFRLLENNIERGLYKSLLVSPFNTRRKIISLIDNEIKNAKKGLPCGIDIKLNNLVDNKLIFKLYDASNAGVPIRAIIRGVCCLIPGIKNQSINIQVRSIVGRYLEHERYLIFKNNTNPLIYISSADWMKRNLDKRIEVSVPILDVKLQEQIKSIFETQWKDNEKSRIIDKKLTNKLNKERNQNSINSQMELFKYYNG